MTDDRAKAAEVTAEDRETAKRAFSEWVSFIAGDGHRSIGRAMDDERIDAIAAALAEARADERQRWTTARDQLAGEWEMAAALYDAAAMDGRLAGDLMAEGGHLIQAGDARRFAARLRGLVTGNTEEGCK